MFVKCTKCGQLVSDNNANCPICHSSLEGAMPEVRQTLPKPPTYIFSILALVCSVVFLLLEWLGHAGWLLISMLLIGTMLTLAGRICKVRWLLLVSTIIFLLLAMLVRQTYLFLFIPAILCFVDFVRMD